MKTRWAPPLTLLVLTPLIAEYLLGSLSFSKEQIGALPVICLMYGGGAVLVRETARARRRGWPAIVALGLAYALAEEGLATQSLFNPHYLHLTLLDYGFVPALGIGANWTVYVLSLHVIWSIAAPIALVEALYPTIASTPWLGVFGRALFAIFLLLGLGAIAAFTAKTEHFMATPAQLTTIVVLLVLVGLFVHRIPAADATRPEVAATQDAPKLWAVLGVSFALGSAFCLSQSLRTMGVSWVIPVVGILVIDALGLWLIRRWSRRAGWSLQHRFALGAGAILVYCWYGYTVEISLHGRGALLPHSILVAATLVLLLFAGSRLLTRSGAESPS